MPVQLGQRTLEVCDVVSRASVPNETPHAAVHALCRALCPSPRIPSQPVYGHNDWYYAYGKNSAASVVADAEHIVELSPSTHGPEQQVLDKMQQLAVREPMVGS